jgi:hypothetical protein
MLVLSIIAVLMLTGAILRVISFGPIVICGAIAYITRIGLDYEVEMVLICMLAVAAGLRAKWREVQARNAVVDRVDDLVARRRRRGATAD